MCGRVVLSAVSLIIALFAVFLALPDDVLNHADVAVYHKAIHGYMGPLLSLFTTCPFHPSSGKSSMTSDNLEIYNVVRMDPADHLFTKDELSKYDGKEGSPGLYLAILGLVYDVVKGSKFYEAGAGYGFFAGRDGTKAFMTGDFTEEGLVDEVTGLSPQQMLELEKWVKFYDENYTYKGKVIGNFYDASGNPTDALNSAVEGIRAGHSEEANRARFKKFFPHCNSHWSEETGGIVWCSENSGGDKREWIGLPRKFFRPGQRSHRCACVRTSGPPFDDPESEQNVGDLAYPGLKEYDGCDPTAVRCELPKS